MQRVIQVPCCPQPLARPLALLFRRAVRVLSLTKACPLLQPSHWLNQLPGRVVPRVTLLQLQFLRAQVRLRLPIPLQPFPVQVVRVRLFLLQFLVVVLQPVGFAVIVPAQLLGGIWQVFQ